jgi:hypothetical protein
MPNVSSIVKENTRFIVVKVIVIFTKVMKKAKQRKKSAKKMQKAEPVAGSAFLVRSVFAISFLCL